MNREEIIPSRTDVLSMAREAGLLPNYEVYEDDLDRFAALIASRVAAKASAASASVEREACAELVENFAIDMDDEWVCGKAAEAIRARGQA